ncbi:MAG: RtcB family protein [Myxococcota bacterium]
MKLRQLSKHLWEIPREGKMRVPARAYWPAGAAADVHRDQALQQLIGVAHLPGILEYALAMPDIHWGYGFPIGGIAAVDAEEGAISPGGVGYDINCGVRLLTTELSVGEVGKRMTDVVHALYAAIPVGVGSSKAIPTLNRRELARVLRKGAQWAVDQGYVVGSDDVAHCEEGGCLEGADPEAVSDRAHERGGPQVGTLGSGNHFVEVDTVDEVFDQTLADAFGLWEGQMVIQIHSGSRGFGHQVCDDALGVLTRKMSSFGADYAAIPDRQLACAPIRSGEGRQYLAAMKAAANFAWANRQVMSALAMRALQNALSLGPADIKARLVYDVCHNIAKVESHTIDGAPRKVLVHRKGATRAYGPNHPEVPAAYRKSGQPVLVPGDMGRYSFVLAGTDAAMEKTFGSACHGAGRLMSRHKALKLARGRRIDQELRDKGIEVMARARRTLGEEMSEAYKDVAVVVEALEDEGIVRSVARLRPVGVIKG